MPKEYIERNNLMDRFDYYQDCFQTEHDYDLTLSIAQGTEIVDDVVEVVRCKDCKFRYSSEFCECRSPNAFCSDGERKDE